MRAVTDDVFSEEWSFEIAMGRGYLKGDQITRRGENKLLFYCDNDNGVPKLLLTAMSELPDRKKIVDLYKIVLLFLDGTPIEMPASLIYETPKLMGQLWIGWSFLVTPELADKLQGSSKIESGISPGAPIFSGFNGIGLDSGKTKLLQLYNQCNIGNHQNQQTRSNPQSPGDHADVALATRLAHNLDREFKQGGMIRLRLSVEDCYKAARSHPIISAVEYCYILDQISCGLDEAFWNNMGKSQPDPFWKKESGTARTLAVLTAINSDGNSHDDALNGWQKTKNAALNAMLSMRR